MRNLLFILFLLFLAGCKDHKPSFILEGKIENLTNDTVFMLHESFPGRLDTIITKNGAFTYSLQLDTITPLSLLIDGEYIYPVYADRDSKLSFEGNVRDISTFQVKGGVYNEDLNNFHQSVKHAKQETIIHAADSFIRTHPASYANLYLMNRYFVQSNSPDFKRIVSLIKSMNGELQDQPYIKQINESANRQLEKSKKISPFFKIKNAKGEDRTLSVYKDKYLLINFWASWDTASMQMNKTLKQIYKKYKKDKAFSMLGISLDIDKQDWLNTIKKDTLSWEQAAEFDGFEGQTVKLFNIEKLPDNVLISPQRTIIAEDLDEKELPDKIEEALKKANNKSNK